MAKIKNLGLLNNYINIDINKTRQSLYIKFISAINNF